MLAVLVRDARPSVPHGAPRRHGLHGFERQPGAQEPVVGALGAPSPKPLTASAEGPRMWEQQCQGWSPTLFLPLQCRGLRDVTCPGPSHTPFPAQRWPTGYSESLRLAGSILFIIQKLPDCSRKLFRKHCPFIYSLVSSRGSFVGFLNGGSLSAGAVGLVATSIDPWAPCSGTG